MRAFFDVAFFCRLNDLRVVYSSGTFTRRRLASQSAGDGSVGALCSAHGVPVRICVPFPIPPHPRDYSLFILY